MRKERKMRKMTRGIVITALGIVLALGSVAPAQAAFWKDAGLGVSAIFVNLLYMPTKFTYATLGALTGSFGFVLTGFNYDVAERIWMPSMGGDYVVTTDHLVRERRLYFSGVREL